MRKLVDYDPFTKTFTYHHFDHDNQETVIETVQDTRPHVELSKALQKTDSWSFGVKNSMAQYAHIPDSVLVTWKSMGVDINDSKELFRMVNKPEYSHLKTTTKFHKA
jgi:hypothetical protein